MRATIMYRAGDVRLENVPDATIVKPTDALVRITRACICGSDLWPYKELESTENGRPMGHEAIGAVEAVGPEVRKVKKGNFVVSRSRTPTEVASFVTRDCRPHAFTAGSSVLAPTQAEHRPKRCVFHWLMARSTFCRSARTKR